MKKLAAAVSKILSVLIATLVIWAAATLRQIEISLTRQDAKIDRIAEVSGIKLDNMQKEMRGMDCRVARLEEDCHKGKEDDRTARGFRKP